MSLITNKYDYKELKRQHIDGKRLYACPDGNAVASVTTILDATKDKSHLIAWRKRVGTEKAKEIIQLGEIVYWPTGKVIAIGFGKTPISLGDEIRLASKCNVWANTSFDLKKLVNVRQGEKVLVEKSRI